MESRCQLFHTAICCIGQKFCDFLRAWHKSWRFLLVSRALYAVRIMCIDFSCSLGKSCRFTAVTFPSSGAPFPSHSFFLSLTPSLSLIRPLFIWCLFVFGARIPRLSPFSPILYVDHIGSPFLPIFVFGGGVRMFIICLSVAFIWIWFANRRHLQWYSGEVIERQNKFSGEKPYRSRLSVAFCLLYTQNLDPPSYA